MRAGLVLFVTGLLLLVWGGVPAVFNFMDSQGFPIVLPTTFFSSHWFVMIYGFFLVLIGNEILVALSNEWAGKEANSFMITVFGVLVVSANITRELLGTTPLFYLVLGAVGVLLYHSRVFLSPSKIGLRPTGYNYLLFATLILSSFISSFQAVYQLPWLALAFPSLTIFAVMVRDVGMVIGGRVVHQREMALAYVFMAFGLLSYFETTLTSILLFLAWAVSLHGSRLLSSRGGCTPGSRWVWPGAGYSSPHCWLGITTCSSTQ